MANKILIEGKSGTGKSYAARNLDPKSTFIICPDEKELPFKGWKKNYVTAKTENGSIDMSKTNFYKTTSPAHIQKALTYVSEHRKEVKVILIDTITLMMNADFMSYAKTPGWDKYTDMALNVYNIIKGIDKLRDDLTVIVLAHVDVDNSTGSSQRSFMVPGGKLIKEKITIPSMFTVVLETIVEHSESGESEYYFLTQNDGYGEAKSPAEMFPKKKIENDYKHVLECIHKYENE